MGYKFISNGTKFKSKWKYKEIYLEMWISREFYKINDEKEERTKIIEYNFLLEPLKKANMQVDFEVYIQFIPIFEDPQLVYIMHLINRMIDQVTI